ncbi:FGGY family carbohydrate kinase [Phytohabitans sp. ZYX-F-186]|uniref:ATP:glycerol 3-phosphotransferase n=1 Tax=Phytohabitans maris TaxID=3071409 RepID=A0ABU0ZMN9_9ACTN|nr:FGGY family carbohydrate kinase [Phytohabitans sp. ZYX-F-186]MDQ7908299.1 FGGY family carbohydrate kinase [Phytohabitans sp. ZYX-F-186]
MDAVLSVDQGTTNTKALLVDAGGTVLARGSAPVGVAFPRPGWVEQDAADIWRSVELAVRDCLAAAAGVTPAAVAVSNQRESVVAWDRGTGRPIGPVLGWQDARAADRCDELARAGLGGAVRRRTGLPLDPMFSAPKMAWLLGAAGPGGAGVALGTVDAWLVWRLTGGAVFACEAGNASRTLLFDLATLDWHDELLDAFGVPRAVLPEVRASDAGFGVTADLGFLPPALPVAAVLADSHAALYQHGCRLPGSGKSTYGTGSSVMAPVARLDDPPAGVATTLAWLTGRPTYAREGNIIASGAALAWMARTLDLPDATHLDKAAEAVDDTGGVHFVPAFSGLGAPYWDRSATGLLTGVTGGTERAHLALAALESVAHQVADVVEAIEASPGAAIEVLHADGAATASRRLMRIQADLLGRPVRVTDLPDASALGAATLARQALGLTASPVPAGSPGVEAAPAAAGTLVEPALAAGVRAARRAAWSGAVARSRVRTPLAESPGTGR